MKFRQVTQHKITPLVCILLLAVGVAYAFTCIPDSYANAKLHIVLDSPEVRRLLVEQGALDKAGDAVLENKGAAGRSQFLQNMASQPGLTLPNGTYLWTSEKSSAKCFIDGVSTAVFQKVRITGWPHHGKQGWTCGPVVPFVDVP